MSTSKVGYLQHCNPFRLLGYRELQDLSLLSCNRSYTAGNLVYSPDTALDSVFFLTEGVVKVCHHVRTRKTLTLMFVKPGELFGEAALFEGMPRNESVEAIQRARILEIPAFALQRLMASHSDLAIEIAGIVAERRQRLECRLKSLLFLPNRERLTHLLLDLSKRFGRQTEEGIRLGIGLSHQELANVIGSTRETVTVILGRLKAEKLIDVGHRQILLTDPDALARSIGRPVVESVGHRNFALESRL